ncbi:GGDEF domain-containing protein [Rheinheimera sp. MMS21-TC3]|uniref:GGDEF domain-containing protein n=1 Tax=Rheinheimera sp. MMS21-TC3 TaxID=3072790 RepID=UPI0028C41E9C|nr:GGDEF domain-containing protein [Rheinheimera sp. MMS21-TC3]WNO59791.1 GGDEF domain-containing protein [Rheinheimera sp. MMS21-TC3]
MQYQDTIEQAETKARAAIAFMRQTYLPANPINYAVSYEYISKNNIELCQSLEQKLAANTRFDNFSMTELYNRYLAPVSQPHEHIVYQATRMLNRLAAKTDMAAENLSEYLTTIDTQLVSLQQLAIDPAVAKIINKLQQATCQVQQQQTQLQQQLLQANQQSYQLRNELEQLKQQRLRDPLTGLFNRSAMHNQVELWLAEQPERNIAAISISLNQFKEFTQQYGAAISDQVLCNISHKISSFIQNSGIAVRSSSEEFLVLLPDIDLRTANEVAASVKNKIAKLRFITARNQQTLTRITLSLGVCLYQSSNNWYQFLARAAAMLDKAQQAGYNQIASEAS